MCYMETYESWLASEYIDSETKEELRQIAGNEKEIEDRFIKIWNLEPEGSVASLAPEQTV